ncbi:MULTISPECIES: iron chaperone [Priestia]|uniref:iron chaperone n=1 Tax=Priestia TaxID=2800373 RepID=UPI001C8CF4D1|nr:MULTISPECIES: iron chaperone [Priestia]MBY0004052.1 iron chaperone [Priestia aryabhattai]MBY0046663.1 iron chaperone [Priestia aryabhattai]MED3953289.1 iron chaperone [Priestia aryabhattai]WDC86974.1 iron chaperone [Priestia megaterium]
MEVFAEYLARIDSPDHRDRTEEVLAWIANTFPNLEPQIKWNTPMFTDHGTFIVGFASAKHHLSVSPEETGMAHFNHDIAQAGYSATKGLFRILWTEPVNYELLKDIIEFNILDKKDCSTFWRK